MNRRLVGTSCCRLHPCTVVAQAVRPAPRPVNGPPGCCPLRFAANALAHAPSHVHGLPPAAHPAAASCGGTTAPTTACPNGRRDVPPPSNPNPRHTRRLCRQRRRSSPPQPPPRQRPRPPLRLCPRAVALERRRWRWRHATGLEKGCAYVVRFKENHKVSHRKNVDWDSLFKRTSFLASLSRHTPKARLDTTRS